MKGVGRVLKISGGVRCKGGGGETTLHALISRNVQYSAHNLERGVGEKGEGGRGGLPARDVESRWERGGVGGDSSGRDAVIPKRGGGCFCATWLEELGMGR